MGKYSNWEWSITLVSLMIVSSIIIAVLIFIIAASILNLSNCLRLRANKKRFFKSNTKIIGFFHPNCDAGAGGEKVLWSAI